MFARLFFILALCTAAVAGTALYLAHKAPPTMPEATPVRFDHAFTLTDMHGRSVTATTFLGKPTLYFFGFTHCPDVCPTTLGTLSGWLTELGETATANLNVVFVSVDPERDTPTTLAAYVAAFHPAILGVTGTDAQLKTAAKGFMAYYAKVPQADGTYTYNHSSMILMADRNGVFAGTLDAHDPTHEAVARLKDLTR